MIEETITNATHYWQHTKPYNSDVHPTTMVSANTNTATDSTPDSTVDKHSVDSTPDYDKSNTGQSADLKNQTSKNNITIPIHTKTNKTPQANRKSLKERKALSRPHVTEDCTNPNCFECAKNKIVNLSDTTLTKAQILLLSKGLFSCQTKKKLRLMVDPLRTPFRRNSEPDFYRKPTTTNYSSYNLSQQLGPKALKDAFLAIRQELATLTDDPIQKQNLTRKERIALKQLTTNRDLIINKADKGSTIVVRSTADYIKEGLEHLSDPNTYIQLERDHTQEVTNTIRHTLHKLKINGLLSPKMADFCLPPNNVRTACIYFLKKIHKSPMGIRPIVSTVNSATANLAEFLDIYLQPIMKDLPAYLKDTTHFISEISNIPLKLNTFEFDNKFYLQKFGTAMGSKLAPAYANTFMGKLEENILSSAALKPAYYRRFIDDIFIIWQHSEKDLQEFITHMNRANRSIQFTHEKSQKDIAFLDVVVYKSTTADQDEDNSITLNEKTHIKPTNKQLYVRNDSYHPPGTGKGITIGEAIRYLRTNSEAQQYAKMLLQRKRNLIRRGYPNSKTTALLRQIKFAMRATKALKKKRNNNEVQAKPTLVTKYCPNANKAFKIVPKHWTNISTEIPILKRFLRNTPGLAYKANPNLANKLVRAKLKRPAANQAEPHLENTDTYTDIIKLANLIHPASKPGKFHTLYKQGLSPAR